MTQLVAYEKGIILVAKWGNMFLNHYDDAPRAIFAAINIKRELHKFQQNFISDELASGDPPVHIGIATGSIFQGVVGRFERKEVVSIGPTVERAFLLMETAHKAYGKIYCDFMTKRMASSYIDFEFVELLEYTHM